MKKKQLDLSTGVAIASLLITISGMIWIGGFRMSALINDVQDLKEEMKEVKTEMKEIRNDLHKIDLRVNTLEQRRP